MLVLVALAPPSSAGTYLQLNLELGGSEERYIRAGDSAGLTGIRPAFNFSYLHAAWAYSEICEERI